jgi:hypothetical protein
LKSLLSILVIKFIMNSSTSKSEKNITKFSKNDRFYIEKQGIKYYGTIICDRHALAPSRYIKHTYKVKWDVDNDKKDNTIYGYLFEMIKI